MNNKIFSAAAFAAIVLILLIGISSFINNSKVKAMEPTPTIYYTSYTVKSEDTLWSIAEKYKWDGCTTNEYVNQMRKVNNLSDDVIKAGFDIIIMYSPEG